MPLPLKLDGGLPLLQLRVWLQALPKPSVLRSVVLILISPSK
jgi:hypothetical protein